MKKRLLALMLAGVFAFGMASCGKDDETDTNEETTADTEEEAYALEYDVDDYVTLGQYKDLEVTLSGDYDYTDEAFDEYLAEVISDAAILTADEDKTEVEEDSVVNVDYVGSQDGVAFDGGSAEDQDINIANNSSASGSSYIEGFSEGLIGHKVGEEVAYEVTFPDDYGSTDLAGETVTFTFQINYIAKYIESVDDLTDDIVSDEYGYDTVDEFVEDYREYYKSTLESNYESDLQTAVLQLVLNNSTVSEVPEELLDARVNMYIQVNDLQYQQYYGTTLQEYYEAMGEDYDEYLANIRDSIEESTETELILEAIAKAEGLEVDEDGYKAFIQNVLTQTGATDEADFYEAYTVDGYSGERYFREAYLTQKAVDVCTESAIVSIDKADE